MQYIRAVLIESRVGREAQIFDYPGRQRPASEQNKLSLIVIIRAAAFVDRIADATDAANGRVLRLDFQGCPGLIQSRREKIDQQPQRYGAKENRDYIPQTLQKNVGVVAQMLVLTLLRIVIAAFLVSCTRLLRRSKRNRI